MGVQQTFKGKYTERGIDAAMERVTNELARVDTRLPQLSECNTGPMRPTTDPRVHELG